MNKMCKTSQFVAFSLPDPVQASGHRAGELHGYTSVRARQALP